MGQLECKRGKGCWALREHLSERRMRGNGRGVDLSATGVEDVDVKLSNALEHLDLGFSGCVLGDAALGQRHAQSGSERMEEGDETEDRRSLVSFLVLVTSGQPRSM